MNELYLLPPERTIKLIENCLDNKGKKIDIEIVLKKGVFSKSEYDDLKLYYGNTKDIKKIEEKENSISESLIDIRKAIKETQEKIKEIEDNLLSPKIIYSVIDNEKVIDYYLMEKEEILQDKKYDILLKNLSSYHEKERKIIKQEKNKFKEQDYKFDKLLKGE